jgi:hypothetical protein
LFTATLLAALLAAFPTFAATRRATGSALRNRLVFHHPAFATEVALFEQRFLALGPGTATGHRVENVDFFISTAAAGAASHGFFKVAQRLFELLVEPCSALGGRVTRRPRQLFADLGAHAAARAAARR